MPKYSAIGPSTRGGKYDNAVMITITANVIAPNVTDSTRKVPADSGMNFLFAINPTIAMGPIIGRNLPNSMAKPAVIFQKGLLSASPSKPLPLFALDDVY